jgi:hypothetical protein
MNAHHWQRVWHLSCIVKSAWAELMGTVIRHLSMPFQVVCFDEQFVRGARELPSAPSLAHDPYPPSTSAHVPIWANDTGLVISSAFVITTRLRLHKYRCISAHQHQRDLAISPGSGPSGSRFTRFLLEEGAVAAGR